MGDSPAIPIAHIYKDNLRSFYPAILCAMQNSAFIGLDMELSGLGDRKKLVLREVDFRYAAMAEVAKTRSVLSLGISCFKRLNSEESEESLPSNESSIDKYMVHTYNIVLLCSDDYIIECESAKFLVSHGFDFNKQYTKGVPYYKGNDKSADDIADEKDIDLVREIISFIIKNDIPLVFHNGMVDLVFLYNHFYAVVPQNLATFLADLTEIFINGVYDTKYIADFEARLPASYLEFVYKKAQRENEDPSKQFNSVEIVFPSYPQDENIEYISHVRKQSSDASNMDMCSQFFHYGWCPNGFGCPESHDVDYFIDNDCEIVNKSNSKKKKTRKSRNKNHDPNNSPNKSPEILTNESDDECTLDEGITTSGSNDDQVIKKSKCDEESNVSSQTKDLSDIGHLGHLAGFDSYMTAYTFAFYISKYRSQLNPNQTDNLSSNNESLGVEKWKDKLSLSGKDMPLTILKSSFSKTSKQHKLKISKLKSVTNGVTH